MKGTQLSCSCSMRSSWVLLRPHSVGLCADTQVKFCPQPLETVSFLLPCTCCLAHAVLTHGTLQLRVEFHHFPSYRRRPCLASDDSVVCDVAVVVDSALRVSSCGGYGVLSACLVVSAHACNVGPTYTHEKLVVVWWRDCGPAP